MAMRGCALALLAALVRALVLPDGPPIVPDIIDLQISSSSNVLRIRTVYGADSCPGAEEVLSKSGEPLVDSTASAPAYSNELGGGGPIWPGLSARPGEVRVCLCQAAVCQTDLFTDDLGTFSVAGPVRVTGDGGNLLEPDMGQPFNLELHGSGLGVSDRFLAVPRTGRTCGEVADEGPGSLAGGQLLLVGPQVTSPGYMLAELDFSGRSSLSFELTVLGLPLSSADVFSVVESDGNEAFALRVAVDRQDNLQMEVHMGGLETSCDLGLELDKAVAVRTRFVGGTLHLHAAGFQPCAAGNVQGIVHATGVKVYIGGSTGNAAIASVSNVMFRAQNDQGPEDVVFSGWSDTTLWEQSQSGTVTAGEVLNLREDAHIQWTTPLARRTGMITVRATVQKDAECNDHYVALSWEQSPDPEKELAFGWSCNEKKIWGPGGWLVYTTCGDLKSYAISITLDVDGTAYFQDDGGCATLMYDVATASLGDSLYVRLGAATGDFEHFLVAVAEPLLQPVKVGELSNSNTTLAWKDLVLELDVPRVYRVCWCQGSDVVGEVGCVAFRDFGVQAGTFAVGGGGLELQSGAVGAGPVAFIKNQEFHLQLASGSQQSLNADRISVVDHSVTCGGADSGTMDSRVSLTEGVRSDNTISWFVIVSQGGTYRVCICSLAKACGGYDYQVDAGTFTVVSFSGASIKADVQEPLLLTVSGTGLSADDRVRLVSPAVDCGQVGANVSALRDPSVLFSAGNLVGPAGAPTELQWAGLTAGPGSFRVCWCGGLGDLCQSAEAFSGLVGVVQVPVTTVTVTTSTVATNTTTVTSVTITTLDQRRVFLLVVDVSVDAGSVGSPAPSDPNAAFGFGWAQSNLHLLYQAISSLTGTPLGNVLLEIEAAADGTGFKLNLVLSLPDNSQFTDAEDAERLQAEILGSGGGQSPLLDKLALLLGAEGTELPWGLDAAVLALLESPTVQRDFLMPITTTTTPTTTGTQQPCKELPSVPPEATGLVDQCVPVASGGSPCKVICPAGFEPAGEFYCEDGAFVLSASPVCVRVRCEPPTELGVEVVLPNGTIIQSAGAGADAGTGLKSLRCLGLDFESVCELECADGYVFEAAGGSSPLFCSEYGNFTGNAVCVLKEEAESLKCISELPIFDGIDMSATCEGLFHGQTCVPECKEKGYQLEGEFTEFQCSSGNLLAFPGGSSPVCQAAGCLEEPVLLRGGGVSSCVGTADGDKCETPCIVGWQLYAGAVTCKLGTWVVSGVCQPSFNITDGMEVSTGPGAYMEFSVTIDLAAEEAALTLNLEYFNYDWVMRNYQFVLETLAAIIGISPSKLQLVVEITGANNDGRRVNAAQHGNRALQDEGGIGSFDLLVVFQAKEMLEGSSNPMEVLEDVVCRVACFNANVSDSFPGLLTGIASNLETQGIAVPEGLLNATITSVDPVYLAEVSMLEPKWFLGAWGECDCAHLANKGGPSKRLRTVVCSVDHVASCPGSPESTQGCDCPTPRPLWGIPLPIKIAGGAGILAGLCCLVVCCCEIRRFRRNVSQGKAGLKDSPNAQVSYRVQIPGKEQTPDGKIHVIWDVDEATAALKDNQPVPAEENPNEEAQDVDVLVTQVVKDHRKEQLGTARSVFTDGQNVEYFSNTHRLWVTGIVKVRRRLTEGSSEVEVVYDVNMGRGNQWRCEVALDMIRLPFTETDSMEIFMLRGGGSWQSCKLAAAQPPAATTLGYTVLFEQDGHSATLEWVPAARLRRCFPAGSLVEVYRGATRGWVNAIVGKEREVLQHPQPLSRFSPCSIVDNSSTDRGSSAGESVHVESSQPHHGIRTQVSITNLMARLRGSDGNWPMMRRQRSTSTGGSHSSPSQQLSKRQLPKGAFPWVLVPVIEDPHGTATQEDNAELVPSWLLRMRQVVINL